MKLLPESLQQEAATAALVASSVLVRARARRAARGLAEGLFAQEAFSIS